MKLQRKITIKGLLVRNGVLPIHLVSATDQVLCYFWRLVYGCLITDYIKIKPILKNKWIIK